MKITMMDAAIKYAELNIPVMPLHWICKDGSCSCKDGSKCDNKGKHPLYSGWHKNSTTDIEQIKKWWTEKPHANIGVPTGEKSGWLVLDVDDGGDATLVELEDAHGKLPDTVTAITGSGGRHKIFKYPKGIKIPNKTKFAKGLDTRSKGNTTRYTYNSLNKLATLTDPLGQTITYQYDKEGRVVEEIDRKGQSISYSYNDQNNITRKDMAGTNLEESYLYNLDGTLLAAVNENNDGFNRLTEVHRPDGTWQMNLKDAGGRVIKVILPNHKIMTAYNSATSSPNRTTEKNSVDLFFAFRGALKNSGNTFTDRCFPV